MQERSYVSVSNVFTTTTLSWKLTFFFPPVVEDDEAIEETLELKELVDP